MRVRFSPVPRGPELTGQPHLLYGSQSVNLTKWVFYKRVSYNGSLCHSSKVKTGFRLPPPALLALWLNGYNAGLSRRVVRVRIPLEPLKRNNLCRCLRGLQPHYTPYCPVVKWHHSIFWKSNFWFESRRDN